MARRRRKSITGRVFQEATRALPGPLQMAFATKTRALVTVVTLGALMSYGVVSVDWQDGRPKLSVDEQKALELKNRGIEFASDKVNELEDRFLDDDESGDTPALAGSSRPAARSTFPAPMRTPIDTARKGRVSIRRD